MSDTEQTTSAGDSEAFFGDLKKNWGWFFALGLALLFLGTIGLGMTVLLTVASVLYFGILLVIGGGVQFVHAFKARRWRSIVLSVLIAVLYIVSGILIIFNPMAASSLLTLMFAGAMICIGILRVVMAFHMHGFKNTVWPLLAGIISIAMGVVIVAGWRFFGLWIIGLFVAIEMIMNGCATVAIAVTAKRTESGSAH